MKYLFFTLLIGSAALLQGCKYPEPVKVEQADRRPVVGISGAPKHALLFVDGLKMGAVSTYNGKNGVLMVESGKHLIEVKDAAGKTLMSEEIFLSNSTTKILPFNP